MAWETLLAMFWIPLVILGVIALILKGFALWRAGRNNQPLWFILLLLFSTAGILPVLYLLLFQKQRRKR